MVSQAVSDHGAARPRPEEEGRRCCGATDHREWVNHVRREYEDGVLDTVIRLNADLGKSATGRLPIVVFDEKCNGFEDYKSATLELLTDLEKNTPRLRVVGTEAAAG